MRLIQGSSVFNPIPWFYNASMRKIVHAKESDMPSLLKCFRRVDAALLSKGLTMWDEGYPSEEDFRKDLESESLFVMKDGARIVASVSVSHDVALSFFPESRSQKKAEAILSDISYQGEQITILHRFFVDPAYEGKGIGKELFQAIEAKYRPSSFLVAIYHENEDAKAFFQKMGFTNLGRDYNMEYGKYSDEYLYAKVYKKDGLCRGFAW